MHRKLSPRAAGVILLMLGGGLSYMGVVEPLRDAAAHVVKLSLSFKAAVAGPAILGTGLLYLVAPEWTCKHLGEPGKSAKTGWMVAVPLVALGGLVYAFVKATVEGYGYRF